MALSQEQIEKLRKQYGFASSDVVETKPGTVGELLGSSLQSEAEKPGVIAETIGDITQTGRDLIQTGKETFGQGGTVAGALEAGVEGKQSLLRSLAQAFGLGAGGVARGIGDVFKGALKVAIPGQGTEQAIKTGVETVATPVVETAMKIPAVQNFIENYASLDEQQKRDVDALFGVGNLALELGTMGVGGRGAQVGKEAVEQGAKKGLQVGKEAVEQGLETVKNRIPQITSKLVGKQPTISEATGQILQGATKDIVPGVKALSNIDTTGVKTFSELGTKISDKITELSKVVDSDLAQDTTRYSLDSLKTIKKTKAGQDVAVDFVTDALTQLDELYTTIGDAVKATDIRDLLNQAKQFGLTRQEVNDIARIYGQEFGQKAFSKTGDALTSVNAQRFENVRKGLKDVARQGIGGDTAKAADKTISQLYNTQRLIQKNIEAVNKLRQKIQDRGLLEKLGHTATKALDMLSGGTIRGLVGGLLPRGAGYKVMNALDLEERLIKNLDIIQKATQGKTVKEIESLLKEIMK